MKNFIRNLIIFSLTLGAGIFFWNRYSPEYYRMDVFWTVLGFFMVSTALVHNVLVKAGNQNPQTLVRKFMLTTVVKFFVFLIFLLGYIIFLKTNAKLFAVFFLGMYFLFSAFEVLHLLKHFGKK